VVVAFTEYNNHQQMASIIPTFLITPTRSITCLYDVEEDVLLLSNEFEWVKKDNDSSYKLVDSGLMLLWIVVNYR